MLWALREYLAKIKRRLVSRLIKPTVTELEARFDDLEAKLSTLQGKLSSLGDTAAQPAPPLSAIHEHVPPKVASDDQLELAEQYSVSTFWSALDSLYAITLPGRRLKCIVCDFEALRDGFEQKISECIFGGGKLERYRCPSCDCIFGAQKYLDLRPRLVDLDYRLLYSRYREGNTTQNEIRTFHALNPQQDKAYLNWGSGSWNSTIEDLRSEGWDAWGYEPSTKTSSQFVVSTKDQIGDIAGIFSNNVIEHFLDPVAQFQEFHKILKPGALMAHSTACYEYLYEYSRFHVVFLLGRSADVLAERTGFRLVSRVNDGEYMNRVFERI